jgi:hypothetical protein
MNRELIYFVALAVSASLYAAVNADESDASGPDMSLCGAGQVHDL